MSNTNSSLIIENAQGEVIRTISWQDNQIVVYINHNTHRIDVTRNKKDLQEVHFDYTILGECTRKELEKSGFALGQRGHLKLVQNVGTPIELIQFEKESDEEIKAISKWTAIVHASLALLLIIGSYFINKFKPEEDKPVIVLPQARLEFVRPTPVRPTLHKIQPITQKAKLANKTVKTKEINETRKQKPSQTRSQYANVNNAGALGALGGIATNKPGSTGFNPNASNSSTGTDLQKLGPNGRGGNSRTLGGAGLVKSSIGVGGDTGGAGYGTKPGQGGGRPGQGTSGAGGGSTGHKISLSEEPLVQGGLTKDQIAAVMERHKSEVVFCYEKELQVNTRASGRISLAFTISGKGNVSQARIDDSSVNSTTIESCILKKLRTWGFPKPIGGVNVSVVFPILLQRAG